MLELGTETEKASRTISAFPNKRQLLVVDDNRNVREDLSKILSFMGHDVTVADNGLQGMALFFAQPYDLVVIDIQMPFMDGWELSRIIKKRFPKTHIVAVTEIYDDKHWAKQKLNRVDSIILKPFKVEEIEKIVRRLLNSET
jgi:CheY-like chemotaxis protein